MYILSLSLAVRYTLVSNQSIPNGNRMPLKIYNGHKCSKERGKDAKLLIAVLNRLKYTKSINLKHAI